MDWTIEGLIHQRAQKYDRHITEDVSQFLFKKVDEDFGSDLGARNSNSSFIIYYY